MPKVVFIPMHVDGLHLKSSMHVVPSFSDFTRLPYVAKNAHGQMDANSSVPWITESVTAEPLSGLEAQLEPGVHLHWALPDALTKATHPLGADGKPDRNRVEFPAVPNRWLVVRRVAGIAQKRWLIESDYLWPANYPWGSINKEKFTAGFLQQGGAIWDQLVNSGWLEHADEQQAVVVDEHERGSNDLGPYQALRADIIRALHELSEAPRRTVSGLVSYPYSNGQADSRSEPGNPPFRYIGRKREVGKPWPQEDPPEYLQDKLTAVGYGEPTFAAFYPNCRSVFGFHDAVQASHHSHQYDVFGWYSESKDDVLAACTVDGDAKLAEEPVLTKDEQFWAWMEKRFSWTLDTNPSAAPEPTTGLPEALVCYGRVCSDSFVAVTGDNLNASITPAVREADASSSGPNINDTQEGSDVHVAVANTGTEALSAYLADRMASQRHSGDAHARSVEKQKIEDYLEALQLSDDLEHRLLDVGAKFAEQRHNKGFTSVAGGSIWVIRPNTATPNTAAASSDREAVEVALPIEIGHQLNALNAAQHDYEQGRRAIDALRWQVYADWSRFMCNAYPPDDEALDYQSSRDHQDVDIAIAYLRHGGVAVLDDLIEQTGELTERRPPDAPTDPWQVTLSGADKSLAGVLKGHLDQVANAVMDHNRGLPGGARTTWILEPTPAPRFYQPNDPTILLAGGLVQPTDRHGEDGRRHGQGHLECHLLAFDVAALRGTELCNQDSNAIAFDGVASRLMRRLEQDRPARIGFRRGRRAATHPFMLEWQVEIAPVRSGGNMPSIHRRFDPWFIRKNWSLGENNCDLSEKSALTTLTDSSSVVRGRGFFTPQAKTLLQSRLETYLLRRLQEYFDSCRVPREQQDLEYLRQNYTTVRAWFVRNGFDRQAMADGRELDRLQQAAPDETVHGIIDSERSAMALAIRRVVNDLPGSVLEEAVGLDALSAQSVVIRRSGVVFILQNYLNSSKTGGAGSDHRKQLLDQLRLDPDLQPLVAEKFDEFVNYLMGGMPKGAFVASAALTYNQQQRFHVDPAAGFAVLVDIIIGHTSGAQLYADAQDADQALTSAGQTSAAYPFTSLGDLDALQMMKAQGGAAGASLFAKIIRFAQFNGYFGALDDGAIARELPSIYGLPLGGPIEAGIVKLANEADRETLIATIGLPSNVVKELLLARRQQPIGSLSHLVAISLVSRRDVALLLHYADVNAIKLQAQARNPQLRRGEIEDQFATIAPGGHAWSDPFLTALDAWYALNSGFNCVSQALTGFNDALLMRRRSWQLPVADPLTFTEYQAFTEKTIRRAVGHQISSPLPNVDFHPLRSGDMQIMNLRLVDTFGQSRELDVNEVVTTNQMYSSRQLGVALSPRISQPARLNFRWLDATAGEQEWNQHPATTPVCGWLVLNNLEARLMIYNTAGAPLGSVDQTGTWRTPPGAYGGVTTPDDIDNKPLRSMVKWLCAEARKPQRAGQDRSFIEAFSSVVESGLENIDPETFEHQGAKVLLMGRPLALVRAAVSIECRDPYAVQQSYEAFGRELKGQPRTTDDFERVRFPVRIGEHMQLNDGVLGYWAEEGQDYAVTYQLRGNESRVTSLPPELARPLARLGDRKYVGTESFLEAVAGAIGPQLLEKYEATILDACAQGRDFFAPQSEWVEGEEEDDLIVYRDGKADLSLWLRLGSPQSVSILMDPRASVHATCGVLPTKELNVPRDEYAKALNAINVSFFTGPVLTARGSINLPLPREKGWQWSWIANRDGQWSHTPASAQINKSEFEKALGADTGAKVWNRLLEKGWLIALADQDDEAGVAPARPPTAAGSSNSLLGNGRDPADLEEYQSQADAIVRIIDLGSRALGPISAKTHFAEQELSEGWLLLSPRPDRKPQ